MSTLLLETQGLGVSFGGVHAVREVDFRLERGEVRCLIGPNGAGKSTFFKMLSGQLRPTRGEIRFKNVGDPEKPELIVRELDLGKIREVRDRWAFYRDRRPDAYDELVAR